MQRVREARVRRDGDFVIFVSHRWWAPTHPDSCEDGEQGLKYGLLSRGLEATIEELGVSRHRTVVWMDFASINQDDGNMMQQGIDSLISYVARSDVLLVPVRPDVAGITAFASATHPAQLRD